MCSKKHELLNCVPNGKQYRKIIYTPLQTYKSCQVVSYKLTVYLVFCRTLELQVSELRRQLIQKKSEDSKCSCSKEELIDDSCLEELNTLRNTFLLTDTQEEKKQNKSEDVHVVEQCVDTHNMVDLTTNEEFTISLDGVVFPESVQKYLKKHQVSLCIKY